MVKANPQKVDFAKKMYEAGNMSNVEIAERLGINANTLGIWIKKHNFTKKENLSEIQSANIIATKIVDYCNTEDSSLLGMINGLLPRLINIMNTTLLMYENKGLPIPLREAGTLLGKLMEIRGKITGETSGEMYGEDSIRSKSLSQMADFSNKFPKLLGTKIIGYSDVIEVEKYTVKEIE